MTISVPTDPAVSQNAPLPVGRFDGRAQFHDWNRQALLAAATEGWREIILCDVDFRDWPLGEQAVVDALSDWARAGGARKCTVLAANYDGVQRQHARFVDWRARWGHLIECRQIAAAKSCDVPSVLWSPQWVMQRIDAERFRGVATHDAQRCLLWREKLREWIAARSRSGFPSTILGL